MNNLNTVLPNGTFGVAVGTINANFSLIVNAINSLEYASTKSKGIHNYGFVPSTTTIPNAVSGDWCMVLGSGNTFPAQIWTFNGTSWSQGGTWNPEELDLTDYAKTSDLTTAIANSLAQATARMGYGVATASNNAYSVTIANYTLPTNGGVVRVKMPTAATGAATLDITNTGAKTIWYNGKAVSSTNTWEAEEIISVFYDGTKYMSSNSQGGGGNAEKIKYNNSQSGISSTNVQGALDEVGQMVLQHNSQEDAPDLSFADINGNAIVVFKDGHFYTKEFSSRLVPSQSGEHDLDFSDENGNVIMRLSGGNVKTKNFNSEAQSKKNVNGKQVIVERFGGEGNDWSFVRTPSNYSLTHKPFPWVILNHGNGWIMDGTLAKANFSSKTQFGVDTQNNGAYMDTTRPDYVKYSSPLIEALLSAGYVVCGAENYDDGLYGNNNCRNACCDFYNYMRDNYNVTERCHMIGASNGCMTTLNACHLLSAGKVASVALLYPLCDLFDHYLHYSSHRAGILSAYGLTGNTYSTLAALKAEPTFYTHCPVHHYIYGDDEQDQQVKTLPLPPMIIYASGGDTVVNINYNADKLKGLCDRSSLVCELTDIDPNGALGYDHGDWHHFHVTEIISFFNINK